MGYTNFAFLHYSRLNNIEREIASTQLFEAASIMKLFIVVIYMMHLQQNKIAFKTELQLSISHLRHTENWSGSKKWQPGTISIEKIIRLSIAKSDSVLINIIIDELGGKSAINKRLATLGFYNTKMTINNFSGSHFQGRHYLVGHTNAQDCYLFLRSLYIDKVLLHGKYLQKLKTTMGMVLLHSGKAVAESHFYHKTGTCLLGHGLSIGDMGVVFRDKSDDYPTDIFVLLSTQTFYGTYRSYNFFQRIIAFDSHIEKLIFNMKTHKQR